MKILVLHSGKSSFKVQVITSDPEKIKQNADERLCRGLVEGIGREAIITVQARNGPRQRFTASLHDISGALEYLVRWIASDRSGITEVQTSADIHAAGHRVVHGGEVFTASVLITDEVLKGIEDCLDLAPLHNPNNIKGILAVKQIF